MQRLIRDLQAVDEIRIFDTLYIRHQSAWSIPCARENDILKWFQQGEYVLN